MLPIVLDCISILTSSQKISRLTHQLITFFSVCLYRWIARSFCAGEAITAPPDSQRRNAEDSHSRQQSLRSCRIQQPQLYLINPGRQLFCDSCQINARRIDSAAQQCTRRD